MADEYRAATTSVGLIDDSFLGKIRVTGKDRAAFLHNILTQDIKTIPPGKGGAAALLSAAGKMLTFLRVHVFEDMILLIVEKDLARKTLELLNKFLITEDVVFEDISSSHALLSLAGPNAEWLVVKCLTASFHTLQPFEHLTFSDGILFKQISLGVPSYEFLLPNEKVQAFKEKILKEGPYLGVEAVSEETAEILRIEAGTLRYGVDMDENTILSETGLEEIAASETKGCYPGQEVVARIKTYGGLHKKIWGLIFDSHGTVPGTLRDRSVNRPIPAVPGTGVDKIGWITSACFSKGLGKGIALGYLQKDFLKNGLAVRIVSAGTEIKAQTTGLPFIRRGRGGILAPST